MGRGLGDSLRASALHHICDNDVHFSVMALLILGCFQLDFLGDSAAYIVLVLVPYYNYIGIVTTVA
jgi:hypothetical protein